MTPPTAVMTPPSVLYTALGLLVMGSTITLPLIGLRRIGRGFYALIIGCGLVIMLLLLGTAPRGHNDLYQHLHILHFAWIVGAALWLGQALAVRETWLRFSLVLVYGPTLLWYIGMNRLLTNALGIHPSIMIPSSLLSALLMGSVSVGMILGHWYLVNRRLSIRALIRFSFFYFVISLLRTLWAFGVALTHPTMWRFLKHDASLITIFTLQRGAFGLFLPPIFAWMIYQTARIRSTQSATGILYAAMVVTLIGEFIGIYLWVSRGLIH